VGDSPGRPGGHPASGATGYNCEESAEPDKPWQMRHNERGRCAALPSAGQATLASARARGWFVLRLQITKITTHTLWREDLAPDRSPPPPTEEMSRAEGARGHGKHRPGITAKPPLRAVNARETPPKPHKFAESNRGEYGRSDSNCRGKRRLFKGNGPTGSVNQSGARLTMPAGA